MRLMKTNEGELGQKGHGSSNKRMTKKSQKWPNNPPMTILKSEVLQKYAPERELSHSGNNQPKKKWYRINVFGWSRQEILKPRPRTPRDFSVFKIFKIWECTLVAFTSMKGRCNAEKMNPKNEPEIVIPRMIVICSRKNQEPTDPRGQSQAAERSRTPSRAAKKPREPTEIASRPRAESQEPRAECQKPGSHATISQKPS